MHMALVGSQVTVTKEQDLTGWKAERALLCHTRYIVKLMPTIMWDQVPTIYVAVGEMVGSHKLVYIICFSLIMDRHELRQNVC